MGRMTAAAFRPRRRRDLGVGGVAIEGMDAETLICEAIHRFTELERALEMNWIADEEGRVAKFFVNADLRFR